MKDWANLARGLLPGEYKIDPPEPVPQHPYTAHAGHQALTDALGLAGRKLLEGAGAGAEAVAPILPYNQVARGIQGIDEMEMMWQQWRGSRTAQFPTEQINQYIYEQMGPGPYSTDSPTTAQGALRSVSEIGSSREVFAAMLQAEARLREVVHTRLGGGSPASLDIEADDIINKLDRVIGHTFAGSPFSGADPRARLNALRDVTIMLEDHAEDVQQMIATDPDMPIDAFIQNVAEHWIPRFQRVTDDHGSAVSQILMFSVFAPDNILGVAKGGIEAIYGGLRIVEAASQAGVKTVKGVKKRPVLDIVNFTARTGGEELLIKEIQGTVGRVILSTKLGRNSLELQDPTKANTLERMFLATPFDREVHHGYPQGSSWQERIDPTQSDNSYTLLGAGTYYTMNEAVAAHYAKEGGKVLTGIINGHLVNISDPDEFNQVLKNIAGKYEDFSLAAEVTETERFALRIHRVLTEPNAAQTESLADRYLALVRSEDGAMSPREFAFRTFLEDLNLTANDATSLGTYGNRPSDLTDAELVKHTEWEANLKRKGLHASDDLYLTESFFLTANPADGDMSSALRRMMYEFPGDSGQLPDLFLQLLERQRGVADLSASTFDSATPPSWIRLLVDRTQVSGKGGAEVFFEVKPWFKDVQEVALIHDDVVMNLGDIIEAVSQGRPISQRALSHQFALDTDNLLRQRLISEISARGEEYYDSKNYGGWFKINDMLARQHVDVKYRALQDPGGGWSSGLSRSGMQIPREVRPNPLTTAGQRRGEGNITGSQNPRYPELENSGIVSPVDDHAVTSEGYATITGDPKIGNEALRRVLWAANSRHNYDSLRMSQEGLEISALPFEQRYDSSIDVWLPFEQRHRSQPFNEHRDAAAGFVQRNRVVAELVHGVEEQKTNDVLTGIITHVEGAEGIVHKGGGYHARRTSGEDPSQGHTAVVLKRESPSIDPTSHPSVADPTRLPEIFIRAVRTTQGLMKNRYRTDEHIKLVFDHEDVPIYTAVGSLSAYFHKLTHQWDALQGLGGSGSMFTSEGLSSVTIHNHMMNRDINLHLARSLVDMNNILRDSVDKFHDDIESLFSLQLKRLGFVTGLDKDNVRTIDGLNMLRKPVVAGTGKSVDLGWMDEASYHNLYLDWLDDNPSMKEAMEKIPGFDPWDSVSPSYGYPDAAHADLVQDYENLRGQSFAIFAADLDAKNIYSPSEIARIAAEGPARFRRTFRDILVRDSGDPRSTWENPSEFIDAEEFGRALEAWAADVKLELTDLKNLRLAGDSRGYDFDQLMHKLTDADYLDRLFEIAVLPDSVADVMGVPDTIYPGQGMRELFREDIHRALRNKILIVKDPQGAHAPHLATTSSDENIEEFIKTFQDAVVKPSDVFPDRKNLGSWHTTVKAAQDALDYNNLPGDTPLHLVNPVTEWQRMVGDEASTLQQVSEKIIDPTGKVVLYRGGAGPLGLESREATLRAQTAADFHATAWNALIRRMADQIINNDPTRVEDARIVNGLQVVQTNEQAAMKIARDMLDKSKKTKNPKDKAKAMAITQDINLAGGETDAPWFHFKGVDPDEATLTPREIEFNANLPEMFPALSFVDQYLVKRNELIHPRMQMQTPDTRIGREIGGIGTSTFETEWGTTVLGHTPFWKGAESTPKITMKNVYLPSGDFEDLIFYDDLSDPTGWLRAAKSVGGGSKNQRRLDLLGHEIGTLNDPANLKQSSDTWGDLAVKGALDPSSPALTPFLLGDFHGIQYLESSWRLDPANAKNIRIGADGRINILDPTDPTGATILSTWESTTLPDTWWSKNRFDAGTRPPEHSRGRVDPYRSTTNLVGN